MRNKDTVTCAAENACGCAAAQTASVFRAVNTCAPCQSNGADWNHWDCNARQRNGCDPCENGWRSRNARNTCGDCAPCNDCSNACAAAANDCSSNTCETGWHSRNPRNTCGDCNNCNDCSNACAAAANDCGCNSCETGWHSRNAWNTCGDCNNCNDRSTCNTCSNTPAMVYEAPHCLNNLHAIEEAIRKGTLFSELYMPMNGECADNCGAQLCDGQAEAFAAWELRLYLNTHPCDEQALRLFRELARRADRPNYAAAFAFDDGCPGRWNWTDAPWPWEFNAACENNSCCN